MTKLEILHHLRNINGKMQFLGKQIMSMNVPGLELVREDLGVRSPKKKKTIHGQVQREPKMHNRITAPDGDIKSDSPNLGPDYPTWTQ